MFNVAPSQENALPFDELYGTRLELSHISVSGATLVAGEDTGILPTGGENKAEATVVFESGEFVVVEAGSDPDGMGLNKTTGIVLPKNDRPFGVEIDVQRNHETATLKATIDQPITFDAGKRYVFTLEVKNDRKLSESENNSLECHFLFRRRGRCSPRRFLSRPGYPGGDRNDDHGGPVDKDRVERHRCRRRRIIETIKNEIQWNESVKPECGCGCCCWR